MDTQKVKTLSKITFTNKESFSSTKIKLYKIKNFILTTSSQELINCAFDKLFDVFLNKNKYIKKECIPIFKKINNRIENINNINIVRMFYVNDFEIHKIALKFIYIFYRFFKNDEIALFYIMKSKNKYKQRILNKFDYKLNSLYIKNEKFNKENTDNNNSRKNDSINVKLLEYVESLKNNRITKFFKTRGIKKLDESDIFKYKSIIKKFAFDHIITDNYCYEVKECDIDPNFVCKINGFNNDDMYIKMKIYLTKKNID